MQVPDMHKCFTLADEIIALQSDWPLRHKTAVFCLIVTGVALNHSKNREEQADDIVQRLASIFCTAITHTIKVKFSAWNSFSDEFGTGKEDVYPKELAVSVISSYYAVCSYKYHIML